jgi:regulator of PEP synthase PpsR (kinase-PPPase family)
MKQLVYLISDSTGITVESLGTSLLAQFQSMSFDIITARYVDTSDKVDHLVQQINVAAQQGTRKPIVFSTLVEGQLRARLQNADAHVIDFMGEFLTPLEEILSVQASPFRGLTHGRRQEKDYEQRIDAVNFALLNDDGMSTTHYHRADLILIGASRSGKTPTSLYLAMQYGLYVANYPLVEEDLDLLKLPDVLMKYHKKLFGLMITAERLQELRQARRPGSVYSSLAQCQHELREISNLYREYNIPVVDVTKLSVEEIATHILIAIKTP